MLSIKNNAVATIENCEDEPIHIPGAIQPHGFIITIDKVGNIVFCSENIESYIQCKPNTVLGKQFTAVLPEAFHKLFQEDQNKQLDNSLIPVSISFNGYLFDCFIKKSEDLTLLECITTEEHPYSVYNVLEQTNDLVQLISKDISLIEVCKLVSKKIQEITAYDRVMIYKFDEEFNGEVVAETVVAGVESFLGLHYPHTDIPKQARQLYLKNLMRLIVDVNYTPIPIVTKNSELAFSEKLDMSNVSIRSVSPIHIDYLKNMGVKATFTISLIKEDKLWGLVACHNNTPKKISYTKQTQAFLQAQIFSSQLTIQETAEKYKLSQKLLSPYKKIIAKLSDDVNFKHRYFETMPEILQIAKAGGAAIVDIKKVYHNGNTPSDSAILEINKWLNDKDVDEYHTENLAAEYPKAKTIEDVASGVLYLRIITSETNVSLLFFRPSKDTIINWAGNPNQKKNDKLTPRNSFAVWQEKIKGKSNKWESAVIDIIFQFTYALQQHLFKQHLKQEEQKSKLLNQKLLKANKELENINWISTHDLREPLRKIQIFASLINEPKDEDYIEEVGRAVKKIQNSATRMQRLLDDLLTYSKIDSPSNSENVDLNNVLAQAVKSFEDEFENEDIAITIESLSNVTGSFFQLQQLFINLIANSIKFKDANKPQHITIKSSTNNQNTVITYCDTGVGFHPNLNQKIFGIFQKGHNNREISGTGIGLSICKKIMENLGGEISASGVEGEGACFTITFPLNTV